MHLSLERVGSATVANFRAVVPYFLIRCGLPRRHHNARSVYIRALRNALTCRRGYGTLGSPVNTSFPRVPGLPLCHCFTFFGPRRQPTTSLRIPLFVLVPHPAGYPHLRPLGNPPHVLLIS